MEFMETFARLRAPVRELLERAMTEPPLTPGVMHQFVRSDYGVGEEELAYVANHVAQQHGYEVHHASDRSFFYVRFTHDQAPHWNECRPDEDMRRQARDLLAQYGRSHN